MPDNINNPLTSPRLAEMSALNPNDTRVEVAPPSRPSYGPMDSDRNISGTGIPATGHFMGDALEWLLRGLLLLTNTSVSSRQLPLNTVKVKPSPFASSC